MTVNTRDSDILDMAIDTNLKTVEKMKEHTDNLYKQIHSLESKLTIAIEALKHYDSMYYKRFVTHYQKSDIHSYNSYQGLKESSVVTDSWNIGDVAHSTLSKINEKG